MLDTVTQHSPNVHLQSVQMQNSRSFDPIASCLWSEAGAHRSALRSRLPNCFRCTSSRQAEIEKDTKRVERNETKSRRGRETRRLSDNQEKRHPPVFFTKLALSRNDLRSSIESMFVELSSCMQTCGRRKMQTKFNEYTNPRKADIRAATRFFRPTLRSCCMGAFIADRSTCTASLSLRRPLQEVAAFRASRASCVS